MKKRFLNYSLITLLLVTTFGCGSDSEDSQDLNEQIEVIDAKVTSFSTEYAYVNDLVSILGENFGSDITDTKVYLDNKAVEVTIVNNTTITIKVPEGLSALPDLKIEIPNTNISFNDSYKNLAVLDNTKNKWIIIDHDYNSIESIKNFRGVDKEKVYFSIQNNSSNDVFEVTKSFNGGVSISNINQDHNFLDGGFFLSSKENEYSLRSLALYRKNKGGESKLLNDFTQNGSWGLDFFVDNDETNIIVATSEGRIYKSTDTGSTFDKVHENVPSNFEFEAFFALSSSQVWLGGYTYPFPENKSYYPAKLLYLKDGNWTNKEIQIENKAGNYEYIKKIHFVDATTGYAIAYVKNLNGDEKYVIIKSETKGDTWSIIRESSSKAEAFAFKNKDIGWYISGKNIFKTVDGGASWELYYTNDTDCKGVLYNEDTLWVIANGKILKHYF
ncbi:IPT/TIG domain-containing protein [Aquimarina macrocephali]|uniref:IPT/TIG domain-containing protein n=1 Tax=Aquimarina macrocephali TaxID=666563 RepID=UPI003F6755AF